MSDQVTYDWNAIVDDLNKLFAAAHYADRHEVVPHG